MNPIRILLTIFLFYTSALLSEESLILQTNKDKYELTRVESITDGLNFFGRYRHHMDYTGGTYIHFFPDYKFIISKFCDICPEEEVVSYGSFSFKDSIITFNYAHNPNNTFATLNFRLGRIHKNNYVTGSLKVLLTAPQLQLLKKSPISADYMLQYQEYSEWRKIKNELMQSKL